MAALANSTNLVDSPGSPDPREKLEKRFEAHRDKGAAPDPEATAGEEEPREKGEDGSQPTKIDDAQKESRRRLKEKDARRRQLALQRRRIAQELDVPGNVKFGGNRLSDSRLCKPKAVMRCEPYSWPIRS